MTATRWSGRADPQACGASPCARRRGFSHDIMRSAAVPKPAENLHSDDTTPHNASLRIIDAPREDAIVGRLVVLLLGRDELGLDVERERLDRSGVAVVRSDEG